MPVLFGHLSRPGRSIWSGLGFTLALAEIVVVGPLVSPLHAQQSVQRALYVSVLTGDGVPIQGLRDIDFLVHEDGVDREVLRAKRSTAPMQVAILVDTSEAARRIIGDLRRGVESFVHELPDDTTIALITFAGARSVLVESTTRGERLQSGISKLFSRPDTATYLVNALRDTAGDLEKRDATHPVIVVLSTTGVDFSDQDPQAVTTQLRTMGAAMHAVVIRTSTVQMNFTGRFGLAEFPSWANRARDLMLDIGPGQTGGHRIDISTVNGLTEVLSRLAFELSNQYFVVYASPDSLVPPQAVQVGVNSNEPVTVRAVPARSR
ncbi:MAG: VWA domain-containing protein [Acidobacteria bacterium]|nr:VWA domain-containing protein [Acidobacteriota bacterium]